MKKVVLFLIIFFISITNVNASKSKVSFDKCIDGDTADIILNKEKIKVRFLAIDTPETKHPTKGEEPYGKEASECTCSALKKAKKIEIEYDKNSDKLDKYERHLVWIFVDGKLLQESLIEKGLAKVEYLYGDYKYTDILKQKEEIAKKEKVGIWSDYKEDYAGIISFILIIVIIVLFIFNQKFRKKMTNEIKREGKKELKKYLKKVS